MRILGTIAVIIGAFIIIFDVIPGTNLDGGIAFLSAYYVWNKGW